MLISHFGRLDKLLFLEGVISHKEWSRIARGWIFTRARTRRSLSIIVVHPCAAVIVAHRAGRVLQCLYFDKYISKISHLIPETRNMWDHNSHWASFVKNPIEPLTFLWPFLMGMESSCPLRPTRTFPSGTPNSQFQPSCYCFCLVRRSSSSAVSALPTVLQFRPRASKTTAEDLSGDWGKMGTWRECRA